MKTYILSQQNVFNHYMHCEKKRVQISNFLWSEYEHLLKVSTHPTLRPLLDHIRSFKDFSEILRSNFSKDDE